MKLDEASYLQTPPAWAKSTLKINFTSFWCDEEVSVLIQTKVKPTAPCPACGCDTIVKPYLNGRYYVACSNSECLMSGPKYQNKEYSIKAWNKLFRKETL